MQPLFCSEYLENSVYFGGYPSKEWFKELIDFGITYFIDLTTNIEKDNLCYNYEFENTIYFPIRDNYVPLNIENYIKFIIRIANLIMKKEKIYIHCKGGHGRSGMVIASLMCYLENKIPKDAIDLTTRIHARRQCMKDKYRNKKCPDNYKQRKFVFDLFRPMEVIFNKDYFHNLFDFIRKSKTRPIVKSRFKNDEIVCVLQNIRHKYNQSYCTYPIVNI